MQTAAEWIESHPTLTAASALVLIAIAVGIWKSEPAPQSAAQEPGMTGSTAQSASSTTPSATDASAEFKNLMETAENAALVSSYEFSNSTRVIYVTDAWNSLTVQFKKDFLAKVAMLQDAMSGKHHFEVRNEHSNEKVGEVTAFTASLEVYK
jgi:hypothetical protein